MNYFTHAESDLLLVKGVQLVVDQLQFLGVRHLMLFLGIRLTRLLNTLAARHRDRFLLLSFNVQGWYRAPLAEVQSSRIRGTGTSSLLSNRDRACARLYLPTLY